MVLRHASRADVRYRQLRAIAVELEAKTQLTEHLALSAVRQTLTSSSVLLSAARASVRNFDIAGILSDDRASERSARHHRRGDDGVAAMIDTMDGDGVLDQGDCAWWRRAWGQR